MLEKRLRLFAKYLSEYKDDCYDTMYEGSMEATIRVATDSTTQKIGDMLQEILDFDESQLDNELNQ
jgi:hypothetical protein